MAQIVLDKVTKRFADGTEAVHEADFTIEDGEFFILVGPSGCGKSTLLNMIVGLEDISAGTLSVDGRVVNDVDPKDRNMAMVFQSYAIYPHMTVRENIAFPLRLAKVPDAEVARKVGEASAMLELDELLDRKPAHLSGGQRQRVAMGRAIVREPECFLMDEPLSNLDAKLRVQMRTEIARLQQRMAVTTVYVTHDQTEAMTLGDRVAVMRRGVVQQVGTPRELYNTPANLFVAGFIGSPSMNFVPAELVGGGGDGGGGDGDGGGGGAGRVRLPMGDVPVPDHVRARAATATGALVAGIRPEHFEDAALVGDAADQGVTFTATVEVLEWMGSELYVYLDAGRSAVAELGELAGELEVAEAGRDNARMVARLDAASEAREGRELELWLDTRRLYLFDAATGENLTLDPAPSGPEAAEPGPAPAPE